MARGSASSDISYEGLLMILWDKRRGLAKEELLGWEGIVSYHLCVCACVYKCHICYISYMYIHQMRIFKYVYTHVHIRNTIWSVLVSPQWLIVYLGVTPNYLSAHSLLIFLLSLVKDRSIPELPQIYLKFPSSALLRIIPPSPQFSPQNDTFQPNLLPEEEQPWAMSVLVSLLWEAV